MVAVRNVLAPLQKLQKDQCYVGSEVWEREQNLVEARRMSSAGENPLPMRSYPILEAAEGNMELKCLRRLRQLQSEPGLWSLVLPCDITAGNVSRAFKMVSRSGALVHGDLALPHTRYPYRAFLRCTHPQLEAHPLSDPVCMRCPWASRILEENGGGAESTRQILLLAARMLHMDITDIECRHASLRRKLMRVQCRSIDVEDLSGQWIGQRCRRRHASFVEAGLKPAHSDGLARAPSPPCTITKAT